MAWLIPTPLPPLLRASNPTMVGYSGTWCPLPLPLLTYGLPHFTVHV